MVQKRELTSLMKYLSKLQGVVKTMTYLELPEETLRAAKNSDFLDIDRTLNEDFSNFKLYNFITKKDYRAPNFKHNTYCYFEFLFKQAVKTGKYECLMLN
jgi:hypothetical protein